MAHNKALVPKKHPYRIRFGQKPLTHFKDYRKAIKVDLVKYDDRLRMLAGVYDFVTSTWSEDGMESTRVREKQMQDALQQMLSGKTLSLGLETINLMFRITGISRIDTHQIVRQRVGVTFSQHCSGDQWWSHRDCLVAENIAQDPGMLKEFIDSTLKSKNTYVDLIDSGKVSIQEAREILPHNLETFIFMNTNISTLLFFYQKRIDDSSQTWQINEISRQMAREVCVVYPEMKPVFEKFSKKFTMARDAEADRASTFATALYLPKEDNYEYHKRDYLYDKTKEEYNWTNTPIEDQYYWGYRKITKEQHKHIYQLYEGNAKLVEIDHMSNSQIKALNHETNDRIEGLLA